MSIFLGVYAAIDFGLANTILFLRNNRWLIIDTTENCSLMKKILNEFVEKLGKPSGIDGLIITHFHPDHSYGIGAVTEFAKTLGQEKGRLIQILRSKIFSFFYPLGSGEYPDLCSFKVCARISKIHAC